MSKILYHYPGRICRWFWNGRWLDRQVLDHQLLSIVTTDDRPNIGFLIAGMPMYDRWSIKHFISNRWYVDVRPLIAQALESQSLAYGCLTDDQPSIRSLSIGMPMYDRWSANWEKKFNTKMHLLTHIIGYLLGAFI